MIADVSGKGLEAARKTAMVKYALRSYAREHASPARVVTRLNDALCEEVAMTGFVTLVYGVLDANGGFTYASAGHELPFLCRCSRGGESVRDQGRSPAMEIEMLEPTGVVLGADPGQRYQERVAHLGPGDGLLLYTDGLSEARDPESHEFLGVDGLAGIVRAHFGAAPNDFVDGVFARATAFAGGRLSDDVAMLWVQHDGVPDAAAAAGLGSAAAMRR
jgi:serine phosphatase RsbU (regulator of sigma subunit)